MSRIDKDRLNRYLTPARRKHAFSELGIEFNGHKPDASGEVNGLCLPDSIHQDTNASLSINLQEGLAHDQGGHFDGDLFKMVQEARGCSFPEALEWVANCTGYQPADGSPDWNAWKDGREAAAYGYVEAEGEEAYEVVRFELREDFDRYDEVPAKARKKFLQRVPGKGWGRKKHGVDPVLYRLPSVLKAAKEGRVVFVVEGEKDVHTLENLGFTATCNPQGAGKWSPRFTESLRGAKVVLIPDNDRAGHEHAEAVAEAIKGTAGSVRIIELPGVGPGGDVTDWIEGGSVSSEDLKTLVRGADEYEPPPEETPERRPSQYVATGGELLFLPSGDGNPKVVADFEAAITEEITAEDGARTYHIEGRTAAGRAFALDVGATTFEQERKLKAEIGAAAGAQSAVRAGMTRHLAAAIKSVSGQVEERRRYTRTGWSEEGFLIGERVPAGVNLALPPQLPYSLPASADLGKAREGLDALVKSLDPKKTLPAVVFTLTGPLARFLDGIKRYAFFIKGRTGSLKTSFLQVLMCTFGPDFLLDERLLKMGEGMTRNAAMAIAARAHDMPLPFDNYKPSTGGGARDLINLVHNVVEGGEKARLNRNAELQESRELRSWLICTGEDVPDTDAASLARMLAVEFSWQRGEANPELTRAQELSEHLPAVGRAWIEWLQTEEGQSVAREARSGFVERRTKWAGYLRKHKPDMVNILRVASNLATNTLAYHVAMQCPAFGNVLARHEETYQEGLLELAIDMGEYTTESLEAQRLLSGLKSLRASGKIYFPERLGSDQGGAGRERVGWKDEKGFYLILDACVSAVEELYRRSGGLGGVTKQTLCSQFEGLDLLASSSRKKTTKPVRIGSGGTMRRVLHLKRAALDENEEVKGEGK